MLTDILGPSFPYLSTITLSPFVGAILIMFTPRRSPWVIRWIAALSSAVSLLLSIVLMAGYDWQRAGFQFRERYTWIPELGINVGLGVDGISVPMVLLTGLVLAVAGLLALVRGWSRRPPDRR